MENCKLDLISTHSTQIASYHIKYAQKDDIYDIILLYSQRINTNNYLNQLEWNLIVPINIIKYFPKNIYKIANFTFHVEYSNYSANDLIISCRVDGQNTEDSFDYCCQQNMELCDYFYSMPIS